MKTLSPKYVEMNYPTPDKFANKYPKSKILVIGTGVSTKKILPYKHLLREKFDAIIGVNFSIKDFEEEMDFHVVAEKSPPTLFISPDKGGEYRKDLPRVFNWKTIKKYPKDMNFVKITRNNFDGKPNIQSYKANDTEGLMTGPLNEDSLAMGTVILQSMHLACILGCSELYLVGADYVFTEKLDHYYNDRLYRDAKKHWGTPIITVEHEGKTYSTLRFFKDSAYYVNEVINTMCKPAGIDVYSFSDGLVTAASKLDVDQFFGGK